MPPQDGYFFCVKCFRSFLIRSLRYLNGGRFARAPAGGGRRREEKEGGGGVERRYTIQRTIRGLKNRCRVGPTILFECPAQIPRPSLRSFSLWARHSAETSAELNVRSGAAEFFPVTSRQVRG